MKTRHFAAALAALLSAGAVVAQQTPAPVGAQVPAGAPATLTLSASAEVQAAPDVADIGAGVITQAAEAEAALRANADKMSRVVAALRKAGVADRDIQTSGLNLQPQFRYAENQPPILTGFQASNRVQVTLRDLKAAGRVIDTLVAEGANQIDGPTFRVLNPDPLLDKARTEAVRKARARAELYAAAAGLRIKRITAISESQEYRPGPPMPRAMMAKEMSADSPVAPGEVGLSVNVTMTFEME
jgi:uncharacterized protein YggE